MSDLLVYEDKDVLVVNKPCGLLTIADEKKSFNLYSFLFDELQKKSNGRNRLFVVHRLDKDTSGLLIFAKNVRTKDVLQDCFEQGAVERKYEAIASGKKLALNKIYKLEINLFQDKNHNVYVADSTRGKKCVTFVKALAIKKESSLLDISLGTGRRNQIRLTLATIGMPLVGDEKYGGMKAKRMMLNAYSLTFPTGIGLKKNHFEIPKLFSF